MPPAINLSTIGGRAYSPLALGLEWSRMGRLIFMVLCSGIGSVMNGFFVAAFFVEKSLQKSGNVFHACAGLTDLVITSAVIPTCAVIVLSGQWDVDPVCYALHFLALSSTYGYNLFFMLVATENYVRICRTVQEYAAFLSCRVEILALTVLVLCVSTAGAGVFLRFEFDYCNPAYTGNFYFRVVTAIMFQAIPFVVTVFGLISASLHVRRRARKQIQYRRSQVYECDSSSTTMNIVAYTFFVLAWTPYLIVVHHFPGSNDAYFYHFVWLGLSRSVISSFLYAFLNRNFRRAFGHLFNYCCCKNNLSSSFSSRHRRATEYRSTTGDIRVHIMHQAINVNNAARFSSSYRETQEL